MDQTQIDELLLYCLRASPDKTGDGRVEPLSEADWDDLLQQSARHLITPLFYHRLRTFHPDIPIPPNVMGRLRQAYLNNAARNLTLYNYLCKVLKILRRDSIPVIVLKGAHLAELIYGNRALRLMGDLDLLVKKIDLIRVDALLLEMGCTPYNHRRIVCKDQNQFAYLMPKRDVSLEIHWSILSSQFSFTIDTDGQWKRSIPVLIAGVDAAVLCPEDLLLHLCLHACKHLFEPGLTLFCDISEILQHDGGGMDWELVQRRTREWGIGKCVYITLMLTRELLGVTLPEGLMEALKPNDFDERFIALARNLIFSRRLRTVPPSPLLSISSASLRFWGSARLRDKMFLFLKSLFLPRETMALLYPPPADSIRIYFYYIVRLKNLLQVYGRDVWRWLRRDEEMQAFADKGVKDIATLNDWMMSS